MSLVSKSSKVAALLAGAALLSACSTSGTGAPAPGPAAPAPQAVASAGVVPDYCPQVSLREGTAILRKGAGDDLQYLASIASTTRSCRVKDGELYMEVGVAGRLVPGPAGRPSSVNLPIRIAIVNAGAVAYTNLGQVQVSTDPAGGPKNFTYVDRAIRIPMPAGRTLTVFAGFDEGAPAAGRAAPKS